MRCLLNDAISDSKLVLVYIKLLYKNESAVHELNHENHEQPD